MENIVDIGIRTSLSIVILFVLTHIAGRKAVSQLTFFDYVNGITIGSIAAAMAVDSSIGIVAGVVSLGVWTVWIMIINFITLRSVPARNLIDSELNRWFSKTCYYKNIFSLLRTSAVRVAPMGPLEQISQGINW